MPLHAVTALTLTLARVIAGDVSPGAGIPFSFRDGLIWLQVDARGSSRPLNFLLDSGAGVSVVHLATARELELRLGRCVAVQGVGKTTKGFWPQHLPVAVNSVPLPKNLLCVDLEELSSACRDPVDGLLGMDFFRKHTVEINFAQRRIRLRPPNGLARQHNTLQLRVHRQALLLPIRVDGGPARLVRLDTGCAAPLHWVSFAAPSRKLGAQTSVALTALSIPMTESTVRLGAAHFSAVPTALHKKQIFPGEAGLLGNGLLSRFESVTIDAHSGRVRFGSETPIPGP